MTELDMPAIIDGTINFVESGIRRMCNITFQTLTPTSRFLELMDDDSARWEIFLGISTLQPVGVYYLRDLSIDDSGQSRNYRVQLQDELAVVAERKTTRSYMFLGDVATIAEQILATSGRALNFTGLRNIGINLSGYFIDTGRDPYATAQNLLNSYGYEVLTSVTGDCVIQAIPGDPSNLCKDITSLKLSEQVVQNRRRANHVIVISNTGSGQVVGEAMDLDPRSPTFILGTYGDVPATFNVDGITSIDGAKQAAERIAKREFGRQATNTFACLQLPKFDLGMSWIMGDMAYSADRVSFSLVAVRPMYLTGRGVRLAT